MSESTVEFYWRPGCPFCMFLERGLKKADVEFTKINIWENADAAAFVRSVADGNEVVPTIKIGETAMVNPSTKEVQAALRTASS